MVMKILLFEQVEEHLRSGKGLPSSESEIESSKGV